MSHDAEIRSWHRWHGLRVWWQCYVLREPYDRRWSLATCSHCGAWLRNSLICDNHKRAPR